MTTEPVSDVRGPRLTRARKGGRALVVIGLATLIACGAVIGFRVGPALSQGLTGATYSTPMDETVTLSSGRWVVFEETGSQAGGAGITFTEQSGVTIAPSDVKVTDVGGRDLTTSTPSVSETITRGGAIYSGAVSFDAPRHGKYRITIAAAGEHVLLSRDLGQLFGSVLGYLLAGGASFFVLAVGVIVLIVEGRRRRKRLAYSIAAPGWYANPNQSGGLLWWDGQRWVPPSG